MIAESPLPSVPKPGESALDLRVAELGADGRPRRVIVLGKSAFANRCDCEVDLDTGRWAKLPVPDAATTSHVLVPAGGASGQARLILGQGEWSGFGLAFLERRQGQWRQDHYRRLGRVESLSDVAGQDGMPAFLMLAKSDEYTSDVFFGPAGSVEWRAGVHLVELEGEWPPRIVPVAADVDLDPATRPAIRVAGNVVLSNELEPVHVAWIVYGDRAQLRVYERPSNRTGVQRRWPTLVRMGVGLPGTGGNGLRARDLDGDGDQEIVVRPHGGPRRPVFSVLGMGDVPHAASSSPPASRSSRAGRVPSPGRLAKEFEGDLGLKPAEQSGTPTVPTTPNAPDRTYRGGTATVVSVLDPSRIGRAQLEYSTYLGGAGGGKYSTLMQEFGAIAQDGHGGITITGYTGSPAFPTTPNAHDRSHNGERDVYVAQLCVLSCRMPVEFGQPTPHCQGAPQLAGNSCPRLNNPAFAIDVTNALPGIPGLMVIGAAKLQPPLSFTCGKTPSLRFYLNISPDICLPIGVGAGGKASFPLPIPSARSLLGKHVYFQLVQVAAVSSCARCRLGTIDVTASSGLDVLVQ